MAVARRIAWFAFPLAGMAWVGSRYGHVWYHADEGEMIGRTTSSHGWFSNAFAGLNGHLNAGSYVVYRLQRAWLGVEGLQFVWLAFCASIAALQVSVAAVLRRLGLPTLLALLAATVVTLFGPGVQSIASQFQLGSNFALALSFGAAFVALRDEFTLRAAVLVGALLVVAIGFDSAVATFGAVFVGVLVLFLWPKKLAALALGPAFVAYLVWLAFGDLGTQHAVGIGKIASFAFHLFTLSAGGLLGGGDTHASIARSLGNTHAAPSPIIPLSGEAIGAVVLVLAAACVVLGFVRRRLDRKVVAALVGGLAAAIFAVAIIAKIRAYLIDPKLGLPGSRFIQQIAVLLTLAFVPAIVATLRPESPRLGHLLGAVAGVALIAIFLVNLHQVWAPREFEEAWGTNVKARVRQTVTVLSEGCGTGTQLDRRANPVKLGTKFTVGSLQELLASGALTPSFGVSPTSTIRETVCRLSTGAPPRGR
jgi:hypothetical protein